jgi:ABC-type sugar transport system permease subunit
MRGGFCMLNQNKGQAVSFRMARVNRMGYVFILPFFLFFVIFNLYPIFYSLILSFFEWNGMGRKS